MIKATLYLVSLAILTASCAVKINSHNDLTKDSTANISAKKISFSGYTWNVTAAKDTQGPGPNYWNNNNVWVDDNGWLHLKIAKNPLTHRWECAEISSQKKFGLGTYQWQVEGRIDSLDKNVVLGLFNYSGNNGHDEMDIEFARWGNAAWPNLNYTLWPAAGDTTISSYTKEISMNHGNNSTQQFTRTVDKVIFKSFYGFRFNDQDLFGAKTFSAPAASISTLDMPVMMNLWLFKGMQPSHDRKVEIVIRNFKFSPL